MNDDDGLDVDAYVQALQTYIQPIANALTAIDDKYQILYPTDFSEDALKDYVMSNFNHTHHWCGSNRMSQTASDGVVDPTGHVHGVRHVVIADNSVIPIMPDANTCAPVYMAAKTIADGLKKL